MWRKKTPPQPKTAWTEPLPNPESSFSELIYQTCCRVKLDMEEQQKELCLLVTEGTWRKIIWDERLRKDLRFDRPTWPGEMAVLYGVRIRVQQQSYPLIDGWMRNAAEEIDRINYDWLNEQRGVPPMEGWFSRW